MQHSSAIAENSSLKSEGLVIKSMKGQQDLLALHHSNPQRYPFLLESVAQATGADTSDKVSPSRFDILFAFPQQTLTLSNDETLSGLDILDGNDFLTNLSQWWSIERVSTIACETLPFCGGWFLYLGYELAKQVEPRLELTMPTTAIAYATRIPAAIINDHETDTTYLFCETGFNYLDELINACAGNVKPDIDDSSLNTTVTEEDETIYLDAIDKVKKYIIDGDVFQVNLSRLWKVQQSNLNAVQVYQKLRKSNPAPFSGLAVYNNFAIISSSPERLIKIKQGIIETRPIAGTRKRDRNKNDDDALKAELIAHPKERAEHIMLIDLERNDLGRVCLPGTIKVDELMVLESYAHVHHIVSNIRGQLREDILPGDAIKAVFPGGTITGCPKERCMAIISELENEARGAYTGSMGYLNHNGDMDINILIRTMTLENNTLSFRAGAGLVADSQPVAELEETRHKARGLLLALQ